MHASLTWLLSLGRRVRSAEVVSLPMEGADAGHLPERPADAAQGQHAPLLASLSMPPSVHSGSEAQSLPQADLPSPGRSGQAPAHSTQSEPAQPATASEDGRWAAAAAHGSMGFGCSLLLCAGPPLACCACRRPAAGATQQARAPRDGEEKHAVPSDLLLEAGMRTQRLASAT